jgi:hypothetical protein
MQYLLEQTQAEHRQDHEGRKPMVSNVPPPEEWSQ